VPRTRVGLGPQPTGGGGRIKTGEPKGWGRLSWFSMKKSRRGWARARRIVVRITTGFVAASALSVMVLRWIPPLSTAFILRERVFGEQPVAHRWTPWEEIAPVMALAVVASEDQKFPVHNGFDIEEIARALSEDDRRRGASTISQQVAKNLFLWPGGGWLRKGVEAYFTVIIEALWPKRRILEVYLNVAEFGPGVFGVGEAADRFFNKSPAQLNPYEAARLAAVLPNPKRMSVANPSNYVVRRGDTIRAQMRRLGGSAYLQEIWRGRD